MPGIEKLPESLINKIAAGEVIERPASIVKELMENAVDAGSTRLDVSVSAGGVEQIRVVDNGVGIPSTELELAVTSHATSKIASADDLFRVGTLGFRGEALASIAEVSRMVLRSRTAESTSGMELEVTGGRRSVVSPCGCPLGTCVEVHNLFFNTPVRRKFLRATSTELGHISEAFSRIALARPKIHMSLRHNDRVVFDLPSSDDLRARITTLVGRQIADQLIWVEGVDAEVRISGYVAHPSQSRGNRKMQHLFLNGRSIRDRSLQHALSEAYRGLLTTGRYPIIFLALEMPAEMVDVNVHPTKLEVRFQEASRLYSQLLSTLRTKFLQTDLTTKVERPLEEDPTNAIDEEEATRQRQQVVDWAKGEVASWNTSNTPSGESGFDASGSLPPRHELQRIRLDQKWPQTEDGHLGVDESSQDTSATNPPDSAHAPHSSHTFYSSHASDSPPVRALQIHNRYLITENDEGVMVIDQHALHERILYEELRARVDRGPIESQSLLVPEPVDLSPTELVAALDHRQLLDRLGMKIEPFGGDTVLVSSYPAMLANMNPGELLREMLEHLLSTGTAPEPRQLLDELLHSIACKAAVKAGDRLAPDEIAALLQRRHLVDDAHHCPHGRPTALVFSREELDRQFKRV